MHSKGRSTATCPLWIIYIIVFLCVVATSSALQCFECDSHKYARKDLKDEECVDEFNATAKADRLRFCSNNTGRYPMRCMKIITYVSNTDQKVVSKRTSRLCAESEYEDTCWHTTSTDGGNTKCFCSEDGCNTAAYTSVSVWTTVLLVASLVTARKLHH